MCFQDKFHKINEVDLNAGTMATYRVTDERRTVLLQEYKFYQQRDKKWILEEEQLDSSQRRHPSASGTAIELEALMDDYSSKSVNYYLNKVSAKNSDFSSSVCVGVQAGGGKQFYNVFFFSSVERANEWMRSRHDLASVVSKLELNRIDGFQAPAVDLRKQRAVGRKQVNLRRAIEQQTDPVDETALQKQSFENRKKMFWGEKEWPAPSVVDENVIDMNQLFDDMRNTYPIFHSNVVDDIIQSIESSPNPIFMRYQNNFIGYFDRLLQKRALYFFQSDEYNKLVNGDVVDPAENWAYSTDDHLNYEEMMFNAQSGISAPTQFINNGNRYNEGLPAEKGTFEARGVYIGLVGARFEKPGYMEHKQFTKNDGSLNVEGLRQRLRVSLEIFLFDANERGKQANRPIFAHVVGLGAGIWAKPPANSEIVNNIIISEVQSIILTSSLSHIKVVQFSYMSDKKDVWILPTIQDGQQNVRFQLNQNNPAGKLSDEECQDCLVVAMYAWDSNSLPGLYTVLFSSLPLVFISYHCTYVCMIS